MDEKMQIAIDEFIMTRINTLGDKPPEALSSAYTAFYKSTEELRVHFQNSNARFIGSVRTHTRC